MKETSAVFLNERNVATAYPHLWQWDYGRILKIKGIDLPDEYGVHFSFRGDIEVSTTRNSTDSIQIPDELLENGNDIIIYLYLWDDNISGETSYKIIVPVKKRPRPVLRQRFRNLYAKQEPVFSLEECQKDIKWASYAYTPYPHDTPHKIIQYSNTDLESVVTEIQFAPYAYPPFMHSDDHINRQDAAFVFSTLFNDVSWTTRAYDQRHSEISLNSPVESVFNLELYFSDVRWNNTAVEILKDENE